jgi:hypothetical protein
VRAEQLAALAPRQRQRIALGHASAMTQKRSVMELARLQKVVGGFPSAARNFLGHGNESIQIEARGHGRHPSNS